MTDPVFSTATAHAIAQAAAQFTERLEALEAEAGRLRFILRILHESNNAPIEAPPIDERWVERWAAKTAGPNLQAEEPGLPAPAPAVAELSAWARRKAREAARDAAGKAPRAKTRKGRAAATKVPRAKNAAPLRELLIALLMKKGAPMETEQLANGAIANGYQTVSNNFKQVAYMLLRKDAKTFRRGADGTWTLTKAAANG